MRLDMKEEFPHVTTGDFSKIKNESFHCPPIVRATTKKKMKQSSPQVRPKTKNKMTAIHENFIGHSSQLTC